MDDRTNQERRKYARVDFHSTLELAFGKKKFKDCITRNISVDGAYIEGIEGPKAGEQGKGTFYFIGPSSKLILELKAEVVRIEDDGIALQFYDVDNDCFCHLMNIVYINYQKRDGVNGKNFTPEQMEKFNKKPKSKMNETYLDKLEENFEENIDDYEEDDDILRNLDSPTRDDYDE